MNDEWLPAVLVVALVGLMFYALAATVGAPLVSSANLSDVGSLAVAGVTAIATIFIARFTSALHKATTQHAEHMESMLGLTRDVQRAYVYPVIIDSGKDITRYLEKALLNVPVTVLDNDSQTINDETPLGDTLELRFRIQNHGKTPATIYSAYASFGWYYTIRGTLMGMSIAKSVLGENKKTEELPVEIMQGLTSRQVMHINAYTGSLAFIGQITFGDIWGKKYTTEFTFTWNNTIERMTLRQIRTKEETRDDPNAIAT